MGRNGQKLLADLALQIYIFSAELAVDTDLTKTTGKNILEVEKIAVGDHVMTFCVAHREAVCGT